jgi:predicted RNA-binding Zn ribbon-like protein
MNKKNKKLIVGVSSLVVLLAGCGAGAQESLGAKETTQLAVEKKSQNNNKTKGDKLTKILGQTNWQGTKVYDKEHNDLTKENANFIGLAKYDKETGRYEFFDAKTGESRGDRGTFFITNDGTKRILISESMNYQAVVDITELTNKKFTYTRKGKDQAGNEVDVFVEHIPYNKEKLSFTEPEKTLTTTTGTINKKRSGAELLGQTLWNGTKVVDEAGNDVTQYNSNFISLAKFAADTNKYEFFNLETGVSRGDFGYFDVINHNKIRAHVSIGQNKYGAALELTELNDKKFTYKRTGKDGNGKDITVFVEHEPYEGDYTPEFSF